MPGPGQAREPWGKKRVVMGREAVYCCLHDDVETAGAAAAAADGKLEENGAGRREVIAATPQ